MDKMEKLRKFIKNGYKGTQAFNTHNFVGDPMSEVYTDEENGVRVDFCFKYDYLEIFGLSDEEYASLSDVLDVWQGKR